MGDLNVNWEVNKARKKLKKVMDDMDMTQVVNGPTRIRRSHTICSQRCLITIL